MKRTILIADDEKNTREGLRWALEKEGRTILLAADGEQALQAARTNAVDLVVTDLRMPKMDGMELFRILHSEMPQTAVIFLTGHGTVESAVDAMKQGAYDYLIKPINITELNLIVDRFFSSRSLEEENVQLREKLDQRFGLENIVGRSEAMNQVFARVKTVAPTRANILLTGESGTGKELVANAIHQNSPRRHKPFIKMNCGALPLTLLESELFGHEKGAFTHAIKTKPGRFELADGGTLLLDEITETSPEFQVRLLRVLQEGEFERVGGTQTMKTDVRVIAATNRRVEELVQEGKFREDLYYRLKVVEIDLPPLRDRRDDIPLLVEHFLEEFSRYYGKPKPRLQNRAMTILQTYRWPGNVRELRNVIEGIFVMTEGKITVDDLPPHIRDQQQAVQEICLPVTGSLNDAERAFIQAVLIHNKGNRAAAARQLGLGRKTLYRKLEEYELE